MEINFVTRKVLLCLSILYFTSLVHLNGQPQRRANIWYFGQKAGLDFSCGAPQKATGSKILAVEGVTGICDEQGNLLFYTNCGGGRRIGTAFIWNRNHEVMHEIGDSEGGGDSSFQGGVVVPDPAEPDGRYYVFTVDDIESINNPARPHRGLSCFLIDMKLNNGLGRVTRIMTRIFEPAAECITAAKHSNGKDFWILTTDFNNRDLIAVPVTSEGIQSPLRFSRNTAVNPSMLKLSPNGKYLFDGISLYHFDASSGNITWIVNVPEADPYSFSFSPSGRYLYSESRMHNAIIRFDLQASDVLSSLEIIGSLEGISCGILQMGPDGNIYINTSRIFENFTTGVSVIQCPDSDAPKLVFNIQQFFVDRMIGLSATFPNIADFWFDNLSDEISKDPTEERLCSGKNLILQPECQGEIYHWSTGATSPEISITEAGTYQVSITSACFTTVETFLVRDGEQPSISIEYSEFDRFCEASPILLTARPVNADTLFWSTGDTTANLAIDFGGKYTVTAVNTCGEATAEVSFPTEACCKVYVPNAFSPDNDGINDLFLIAPFTCDFTAFQMRIFSRWGELIFETNNFVEGWNGKLGNEALPPGVYIWTIIYVSGNAPRQKRRVESGEVNLIR